MSFFEELLAGHIILTGGGTAGGTPANVAGLKVSHKQVGNYVTSVFTLTNVAQAIVSGTDYQSTLLYTFPKGRIDILGVVATLQQTTTSPVASTLLASSTGAIAVGSAAASSTTLSTTMADMLPSTAFTSSATTNVAGTAVSAPLAASAQFDGTTTAIPVNLNTAYATGANVAANATQTISGTITINWVNLGAY